MSMCAAVLMSIARPPIARSLHGHWRGFTYPHDESYDERLDVMTLLSAAELHYGV